jgi:deoxyribodipyrimidine photo-lyase
MHGVIRRFKSRQHWDKRWEVMRAEPKNIDVSHLNLVQLENTFYDAIREKTFENIVNRNKNFQQGGGTSCLALFR